MRDVGVGLAPAFAERRFDSNFGSGSANAAFELTGPEAIPEASTRNRHLHNPSVPL